MSRHPRATRDDHEKFCTVEGWRPVKNARAKNVGHHATYELAVPDGRILRTRISRPVDRTTYGASLWAAILRDQLCVDSDEFWACVTGARVPNRGAMPVAANALPLTLVRQLTKTVGLAENVIAGMTKEDAVRALNDYWLRNSGD